MKRILQIETNGIENKKQKRGKSLAFVLLFACICVKIKSTEFLKGESYEKGRKQIQKPSVLVLE